MEGYANKSRWTPDTYPLKYPSHVSLTDKQTNRQACPDNECSLPTRLGGHLFIGTPVNWMSPATGVGQARVSRVCRGGEKKDHLERKRFI